MRSIHRSAFTLVELLVVITIIGILVGLTMPAVNSARESARRAQCSNNLHQLGMACLAHEAAQSYLPSGGWSYQFVGDPDRGFGFMQPGGWHYNILPYIDQKQLHDLGGASCAQMPVAAFLCPTRHKLQAFPMTAASAYLNVTFTGTVIGRSDYAANAGDENPGSGLGNPNPLASGNIAGFDWSKFSGTANSNPSATAATGPIFRASQLTMGAIKDGASFTYLVGERYIDGNHYYDGGGSNNDQGWDQGYDYDTVCWTNLPPMQDTPGNGSYTIFGSAHPAGFHMAFCDGSVKKLNFTIDPVVHRQLGNRSDGQPTQLQNIN